MIPYYKTQTDMQVYWFASILLILIFSKYGVDFIRFILMKLYEFLIQRSVVSI
jgi:hypothetical protein